MSQPEPVATKKPTVPETGNQQAKNDEYPDKGRHYPYGPPVDQVDIRRILILHVLPSIDIPATLIQAAKTYQHSHKTT